MKRLAIQFFGHLRTFEKTYESFIEHIIKPNEKNYEIDIFMHTWDELECTTQQWHDYNRDIKGKELTPEIIDKAKKIYSPKEFKIEHLGNKQGRDLTVDGVTKLCDNYEKKENIKYDIYLYTRPDVFFNNDLVIDKYLDLYNGAELKKIGLTEKYLFCGNSGFNRLKIVDSRYIGESDIIWFGNSKLHATPIKEVENGIHDIAINYILYRDFYIKRTSELEDKTKKKNKFEKIINLIFKI